jgi:hypothetical protein
VLLIDLLLDVLHLVPEAEPGGEADDVGQAVRLAVLAAAARVVDLAVERLAELARVGGLVEARDRVERFEGLEGRGQQLGRGGEQLRVAVLAVEFAVGDERAEDDEAALDFELDFQPGGGGQARREGARTSEIHTWTDRVVRNQCMNVFGGGNEYGYCFDSKVARCSTVGSAP